MDLFIKTKLMYTLLYFLAVSISLAVSVSSSTKPRCTWGFQCANNQCVANLLKCNGIDDCGDYSDEKNCSCPKGKFSCKNGYRCITDAWVCDDDDDCGDNSDESNCTAKDPCAQNNGGCNHNCTVVNSAKQCSCGLGYYLRTDGVTCEDIDECIKKDICSGKCHNTYGSYYCDCKSGLRKTSDQKSCLVIDAQKTSQRDINECNNNNGDCEQLCKNTHGSYLCDCKSGYRKSYMNPKHCADIDECGRGVPNCHECLNIAGGYICKCEKGFIQNANKTACLDINECDVNNGGCEHICKNLHGRYKCTCKRGFIATQAGAKSCKDLNECSSNNGKGPCQHTCINKRGTYQCVCDVGFKLDVDGISCIDVDECKLSGKNLCNHICVNNHGSFYCTCKSTFFLASDGKTCRDTIDYSECGISNALIQESPQWEETHRKAWPWIVHFKIDYSSWISMPVYGCIGVILNENWVITAHHCATDNDLVVKTNIGESYKVNKTFQPCDSYSANCKSDLALIKLVKPIKFALSVRPICLPKPSDLTAAVKDRSKTLAMVLLKENQDIKKKTVRISRPKDCTARSFSSRTMICAGSRKDTCPPDSGSPLMFSSREHGKHHIKYLGGILSWGRDLFEGECDSKYSYLAYNDLRKHGSWIRHIIKAQE